MPPNRDIWPAIIARLTAGHPAAYQRFIDALNPLSDELRARLIREVTAYEGRSDIQAMVSDVAAGPFLSADEILQKDWPEPVWIIPGLLPTGLSILGGAPKMGKSWLGLQLAQAKSAGGMVFGEHVERGPVLYLALEDPPRRLKDRMIKQHWSPGLETDFMTVGKFQDEIGDLRNGGGEKLALLIEIRGYHLLVIDTLSRAVSGDQNDAREMTEWLTPLQEMAQEKNCCVLLLDHHNKVNSEDAVRDILGSTAKGAMADTIIGLYRERGKPGARLTITGREVEEKTLEIRMDWVTGSWQYDTSGTIGMTQDQIDLLLTVQEIGPATLREICDAMSKDYEKNKSTIHKRLESLENKNRVSRTLDRKWEPIERRTT